MRFKTGMEQISPPLPNHLHRNAGNRLPGSIEHRDLQPGKPAAAIFFAFEETKRSPLGGRRRGGRARVKVART